MTTLSTLPYYHGSIDIRESREMLPDLGDFLIRNVAQEVDKNDGTGQVFCVLTTAVTPEQASDNSKMLPKEYSLRQECTTRLKSYAINLNGGFYSVQGSTTDAFPTLEALCESYMQTRQPLPAGGMLLKGVIRRPWQLFRCDVELPEPEIVLGSGEFGKVVKGKLLKAGVGPIDVAIKMATDLRNAEITSEIYTEARAMRALIHPNIIRLEGVVVEKLPVMLVIEFMEGSSLLDALQKKRVANEFRFPICMAVLYAVLHMHINSYIHRDIAARNVMVSHDCRTVKLIDFGLAKHGTQFILNTIGKIPLKRLAPEVLTTKTFSTKSDTWALAICFWEIFHDGAEIYSNVVPSIDSKPIETPVEKSPEPLAKTSSTSKNNPKMSMTRKRVKAASAGGGFKNATPLTPNAPSAPVAPPTSATPVSKPKAGSNQAQLVITQNVEYLPKEFIPMFKQMTEKKGRKRIELAAMAHVVETVIMPTLPPAVQAELKVHVDKRVAFDKNFKVNLHCTNSVITVPTTAPAANNPSTPPAPPTTGSARTPATARTPASATPLAKSKTVTRRRNKGMKSDPGKSNAQSSGSIPEKKTDKNKTARRKK